jgi:taurine dioxygenase
MNAPSLGFAVAPLTPAIGGVVTGLDLAGPLSEAVIARLTAAVAERRAVDRLGRSLDPAAHRRFAARFGKLHIQSGLSARR